MQKGAEMKTTERIMYVSAIGILLCASTCLGDVPVPGGLNVGDTYHLAFVTSSVHLATFTDISVYDAIVQGAADAAGIGSAEGIVWRVIGSTVTVDARDHALVTSSVFRLDGVKVADDFADMWDGSIDAAIEVTEQSSTTGGPAWTGSLADGTAKGGDELGDSFWVWSGYCHASDQTWIDSFDAGPSAEFRLYGLSEELTVVPAPGAVVLGAIGLGMIGWCRRRKHGAADA